MLSAVAPNGANSWRRRAAQASTPAALKLPELRLDRCSNSSRIAATCPSIQSSCGAPEGAPWVDGGDMADSLLRARAGGDGCCGAAADCPRLRYRPALDGEPA